MLNGVAALGDLTLFAWQIALCTMARLPRRDVLMASFYEVGVRSLPVVVITGGFLGMVLAVQSFNQLKSMHLENQLGAITTMTLVTGWDLSWPQRCWRAALEVPSPLNLARCESPSKLKL